MSDDEIQPACELCGGTGSCGDCAGVGYYWPCSPDDDCDTCRGSGRCRCYVAPEPAPEQTEEVAGAEVELNLRIDAPRKFFVMRSGD